MQNNGTEEQVIVNLCKGTEFYNRAGNVANIVTPGNPDATFVRALFYTMYGQYPGQIQVDYYLALLASHDRAFVAGQMVNSSGYRTSQVQQFYLTYLHRKGQLVPDVAKWVTSSLDLISIAAEFTASPEYLTGG